MPTKAQLQEQLDEANAKLAKLDPHKIVKIALTEAERHSMCHQVERTIRKAGLGDYIPDTYGYSVYVWGVRDEYYSRKWDTLAKAVRAAKSAFGEDILTNDRCAPRFFIRDGKTGKKTAVQLPA